MEQLATVLRALVIDFANRDLALLGLARAGFSFASWSFAIALAVYAFEVGGAFAVGLIGLVRLAPGAIAAPLAGVLVDRHPRRSVLVGGSALATTLLGAAAAAAALDAPTALIFVIAGGFTISLSGYLPAEAALLPSLARTPQELSGANVAYSALDNCGFLLGSLGAGLALTLASPGTAFLLAALGGLTTTILLLGVRRDRRPEYVGELEIPGILRQTTRGFHTLREVSGLSLLATILTLLVFFEGVADVLVVILALDLMGLDEGNVGFLNGAWGVGALIGAAGLTLLLRRGRLAVAIAGGGVVLGVAVALPAAWPVAAAAYVGWVGIGIGYTFIEVAALTLLQRLGSDETLGRAMGSLEAARNAAMALGSISAAGLVALVGSRGALLVLAVLLPSFILVCWTRLRAHEIGAPVSESSFRLLRENPIFAPLPIATLERLSHDLLPITAQPGDELITQGDHGDSFYLIEEGEVEVWESGVLRRCEGPGESFGEIALLHDVRRTATVRAIAPTRLLRLGRDQFITAVTGHRRSGEAAYAVADARLGGAPSS